MKSFVTANIRQKNRNIIKMYRALKNKPVRTPTEEAACKAYRRSMIGAFVLVGLMLISTFITTILAFSFVGNGAKRQGTIEGGFVRYTMNAEYYYIALEDLGLSDAGLADGDQISLFFDNDEHCTDAKTPYDDNMFGGLLVAPLVIWCTLLIIYAMIARFTPWGKAWSEYICEQQNENRANEKPTSLTANIIIYGIAVIIAIVLCWPQIASIIENTERMKRINQRRSIIQAGDVAAQNAEEMIKQLEQLTNRDSDETTESSNEGVKSAIDSANKISELLKEMNEVDLEEKE